MGYEFVGTVPDDWPTVPGPHTVEQILDIIAQGAKIDRFALVPSATLESLNIASLDMVEILFEIEEKFNVYIPMADELSGAVYLRDLVNVLVDLINSAADDQQQPA